MTMKTGSDLTLRLALLLTAGVGFAAQDLRGEDLVPLPIKLPTRVFWGTSADTQIGPGVERPTDKPRPPFLAPKDCVNLALKQKVTSSDTSPLFGTLELVTDGDKEASDTASVALHKQRQWVQIDLGAGCPIYAIVVWHAQDTPQVYHDVVVQASDDPDFGKGVTMVYNNDGDNSSGLGTGTDKEYLEDHQGRLLPVKGVKARYVRCYSRGSTYSALNSYTEVEVWGLPAE